MSNRAVTTIETIYATIYHVPRKQRFPWNKFVANHINHLANQGGGANKTDRGREYSRDFLCADPLFVTTILALG